MRPSSTSGCRHWTATIPVVVCAAMVGACSASSDGAGGAGGLGSAGGAAGSGPCCAGATGTGGSALGGASGSSSGGTSNGGAPGSGGTPGNGGSLAATGGASALRDAGEVGGSSSADASPGACTNTADEAFIGGASFDQTSTTCGTNCFVNLDPTVCATACMAQAGLSQGCAACYGADIECGIAQCAGPCAVDSASAACRDCVAQHCDPAFVACAGKW